LVAATLLLASWTAPQGQPRPRARDLGVPFEGSPGPLNAITDVAGVTVGHATIISGEGPLVVYGFKGGIGTASRRLAAKGPGYTVGVLVQANFGLRRQLIIAGVPAGREIPGI
jgi:L-aminopeptidase/D-esterase-like protein